MTNICPQHEELNEGSWQRLEHWITEAAVDLKHVYVISGPIFGDSPKVVTIGPDRSIQIPDAFYMILVDMDKEFRVKPEISLLAYRFAQNTPRDADFKDRTLFGTSVRAIEEATKLDFFPGFPAIFSDWDDREKEVEMTHWPVG